MLGTYLAVLAGAFIVGNPSLGENSWRWGFVIGALPALLTLWIRWKLREPDQWVKAQANARKDATKRAGQITDLFSPELIKVTLVGLILATIGLATFWGVHIYGRELLRSIVEQSYLAKADPSASPEEVLATFAAARSSVGRCWACSWSRRAAAWVC